jgi:hypothetical protein
MAIPSSGALSLQDIEDEFGGTGGISLSEYYAGGAYVDTGATGDGGPIPTSGTLAFSDFYGASNPLVIAYALFENNAPVDTSSGSWYQWVRMRADDSNWTEWRPSGAVSGDPLEFWNWASRASLPAGSTIVDLSVQVRGRENYKDAGNASRHDTLIKMGAGTEHRTEDWPFALPGDSYLSPGTPAILTLSGDPTYWGLSNADLLSAIKATLQGNGLTLTVDTQVDGNEDPEYDYIKMQVTYTPP